MVCHFANSNCYFIDVTGTVQEDLTKEIETWSAQKLGCKLGYEASI